MEMAIDYDQLPIVVIGHTANCTLPSTYVVMASVLSTLKHRDEILLLPVLNSHGMCYSAYRIV